MHMELAALLTAFLVGLAVGSFLNVVVYRYQSGLTMKGRSLCLSCGRRLSWFENIPLASFIALRGRCRTCRTPLSLQYPVVELLGALAAAGVFVRAGGQPGIPVLLDAIVWFVLILIVAYDVRHKIIPDPFVAVFVVLALAKTVMLGWSGGAFVPDWFSLAAGPVLFVPFFLLWFLSGGRWIGLGDGKLVLGIGWLLGMSGGISAVLMGFWSGAAASILLIALSKNRSLVPPFARRLVPRGIGGKTEVPFAPFLILGTALVYFFQLSVISF